jgi:UDP-galactopyranose mutase
MRSPDVVLCLAHRRWSCYYERSQHLMSECARERRAIFVEEPEIDTVAPDVELSETRTGVITLIPHLPPGLTLQQSERAQRRAVDFVLAHHGCLNPVVWYYTPKAIGFTDHLEPAAIVYDWLETLPAHANDNAPRIGHREQHLLDRADVVFTDVVAIGGSPDHRALLHHNLHAFSGEPSWQETWRCMWSHVEAAIETRRGRILECATQPRP